MSKFQWTRRPDFKNISVLDYNSYWEKRGFNLNNKLKEREEIILKIVNSGSKIFDIGCGNSLLPIKLKEAGNDVVVGDISNIVLENYRKYKIDGVEIDLENLNNFRIQKRFNYIILSEVLEHIKNPEEVIKKLKEHTDYFIITIPNSAYYRFRLHLLFRGRFFTQWVYHPSEHLRFWSYKDFIDWLRALDLDVLKSYSSNGFSFFSILPWLKNLNKNLFGFQIVYLCKIIR